MKTIHEVAILCNLNTHEIIEFVSYKWIEPFDSQNLIFDDEDLNRLLLIIELRDRLGVNDEGIPIILHLVDQLNFHFYKSQ